MKSVNTITKEEQESDTEEKYNETEIETDLNNYSEEELIKPNLEVIKNNKPKNITIGQHTEFVGPMSQGVNLNGYFLDLNNVYEEQEINKKIEILKLI